MCLETVREDGIGDSEGGWDWRQCWRLGLEMVKEDVIGDSEVGCDWRQ